MPKTGRPVVNIDGTERPITGHKCPVIRHCLKAGPFGNWTIFENAENRTSGFRTLTVHFKGRIFQGKQIF